MLYCDENDANFEQNPFYLHVPMKARIKPDSMRLPCLRASRLTNNKGSGANVLGNKNKFGKIILARHAVNAVKKIPSCKKSYNKIHIARNF